MKILSPHSAYLFFRSRLTSDVEEFWIAALNSSKEAVAATCLFRGTVDHCLFHPRDVFRYACLNNASSIIIAHNHPSGDVRPSPEDLAITGQLLKLAVLLEVPLIDHLILGRGEAYFSFLENGQFTTNPVALSDP